ncbi:hypothetical protein Cni_G27055 [Canna indica]|uniref:Uncharacterized protein n=1 Tax=Canna indica TaxID=4628 RepID=A0AAQ3L375_9LILI|nr:hypothetical protein Cni_G27055 [Canna indica]
MECGPRPLRALERRAISSQKDVDRTTSEQRPRVPLWPRCAASVTRGSSWSKTRYEFRATLYDRDPPPRVLSTFAVRGRAADRSSSQIHDAPESSSSNQAQKPRVPGDIAVGCARTRASSGVLSLEQDTGSAHRRSDSAHVGLMEVRDWLSNQRMGRRMGRRVDNFIAEKAPIGGNLRPFYKFSLHGWRPFSLMGMDPMPPALAAAPFLWLTKTTT